MGYPAFIEIDGRRYLWRDILLQHREQRAALAKAQQPALFEMKLDRRPEAQCSAAGRYLEPSLFCAALSGRPVIRVNSIVRFNHRGIR